MTHFAFLSPPYAGHLDPMLALARGLVERGHRATFVAQADVGQKVSRPDIGFVPVGGKTHPPGRLTRMTARLGGTTGLFGIGGVIRDMAGTTDMLCEDVPAMLHEIHAGAIVADQTEPAGGLVARHLGIPFVSVANALLIDREPSVPPPFIGWGYDATRWGVQRNLGGYRIADWLMKPVFEVIGRRARAWGLGGIETIEDCLSPMLQVSQSVEGFDFPRETASSVLVHCGPFRQPEERDWPPIDGRPSVFCSLGTLQGGRLPIFKIVAEACRERGLALTVAHGGKLDAAQAASLPGDVRVEAFVPQRAVVRIASAVVTHGGLNTVLDALAAGVPLIVVPLAFEQGAIAARVARTGAGLVIPRRQLTSARVAEALGALLGTPSYRERAAALRDEIAVAGGVERAVALIERATRPRR